MYNLKEVYRRFFRAPQKAKTHAHNALLLREQLLAGWVTSFVLHPRIMSSHV